LIGFDGVENLMNARRPSYFYVGAMFWSQAKV